MQKSQAMLSNINQGRDTRHSLMTPARNIYVNLSGRSLHSRRFPWHTRLRNFNKQWAAGMWADPNKAGPGVKTRQSQWPGAHGQCGVIIHVITLITRHGAPHCHCPVSRSSWHHPCLHDRFCAADADNTGLTVYMTWSGELRPSQRHVTYGETGESWCLLVSANERPDQDPEDQSEAGMFRSLPVTYQDPGQSSWHWTWIWGETREFMTIAVRCILLNNKWP